MNSVSFKIFLVCTWILAVINIEVIKCENIANEADIITVDTQLRIKRQGIFETTTQAEELLIGSSTTTETEYIYGTDDYIEENEATTEKYKEGYVFDEPLEVPCAKWGDYIPKNERESIEDFEKRWSVPHPKKIGEKCDSSSTAWECVNPLECINNKCECPHIWNSHKKTCHISPGQIPKRGPGCITQAHCVELAECYTQFPCHCQEKVCKMAYGICLCKYPVPPYGFRDGDCIRSRRSELQSHHHQLKLS